MMMTNVRGYVGLCEKVDDADVVELLNECFTVVGQCAKATGGVIDKCIADQALVVFGVFDMAENLGLAAVEAGLKIRDGIDEMNARRGGTGRPVAPVGIAIHVGSTLVGNMGTDSSPQYTALGRPANVVFRLAHIVEAGQIIITEDMRQQVHDTIETALLPAAVETEEREIPLYEVIGRRRS